MILKDFCNIMMLPLLIGANDTCYFFFFLIRGTREGGTHCFYVTKQSHVGDVPHALTERFRTTVHADE